jgi:hypothetical protein
MENLAKELGMTSMAEYRIYSMQTTLADYPRVKLTDIA